MKADAIATRMSVLGRALPSRVLLVDDDELELELMTDRLEAAGLRSRVRRQRRSSAAAHRAAVVSPRHHRLGSCR